MIASGRIVTIEIDRVNKKYTAHIVLVIVYYFCKKIPGLVLLRHVTVFVWSEKKFQYTFPIMLFNSKLITIHNNRVCVLSQLISNRLISFGDSS
jgi:hypothetical protein